MIYDVRPFWLIGALCGGGFGLLMLLVRKNYPDYLNRVLLFLGAANLCLGAAYILRYQGIGLGRFLFEVVSSTLVITCLSLEYRAVCELKRLAPSKILIIVPPLLTFAFCAFFSFFYRNITIQLALVNVVVMAMLFLLAWTMSRADEGERRFADVLASATYGLLGLSTCAVIADYLRVGQFSVEYNFNIRRTFANNATIILAEGVIAILFLLMVSERLNRDLVVQAMHDPLTGRLNRRALEEIAFREVSGIARSGQALSVVMFDIDHFKLINDKHGHAAGDAVLSGVAAILRRSLRDEDFLSRWGGDEFCALLPRARREQAENVAERARLAVEESDFQVDGKSLKTTLSAGIATDNGAGEDFSALVKLADDALYRAKDAGRNRFASASDEAGSWVQR
ncbi:MAG: GGDEF domain-containing protein [Terracidiphilus sp.]|nr:GGDEF domain-containing protein [Terracidiphilus sp.]